MPSRHYLQLGYMTVVMFVAMYLLMYAMVDRFENLYPNVNQFYMAGVMTAPMVVIELVVMREMYKNRAANIAVAILGVLAFAAFWVGIRQQVAVTDQQFLKSMIPHHAGAILMCEEAPIEDAEIKSLCQNILRGQQSEIAQMKTILSRVK